MREDEPGELVEGLLQEEEVADSPHEVIVSALLLCAPYVGPLARALDLDALWRELDEAIEAETPPGGS